MVPLKITGKNYSAHFVKCVYEYAYMNALSAFHCRRELWEERVEGGNGNALFFSSFLWHLRYSCGTREQSNHGIRYF